MTSTRLLWTGRDRFSRFKRDIKTQVLRHLLKWKHRVPVGSEPGTDHPPRIFVEIGTGTSPEWTYLIRDDWRDIARRKQRTDPLRSLPESVCAAEGNWHGYLIEAHPHNFSQLVETTLANKHYRPFLQRLTFINAAIGAETSHFTSMGFETGRLKGLFVNRWTLAEARPYHPSAVENSVTFRLFTVSLETLFSAIGQKHIDLLRMDIEGAEVPVLKAYPWQIKPKRLSVEYHSSEGYVCVREIFTAQGYTLDAQNGEEIRGVQR